MKSYFLSFDADVPLHDIGLIAPLAVMLALVSWPASFFYPLTIAEGSLKIKLYIAKCK